MRPKCEKCNDTGFTSKEIQPDGSCIFGVCECTINKKELEEFAEYVREHGGVMTTEGLPQ